MQERSPYNRVEQKGKLMELGWDLHLWEGAVKEERFLHPRSPFTGWEISQDRKEVSEAQKRVHRQLAAGRTQRPEQRVLTTSMTPQLEMLACWCAKQLGAKTQASADRPGERSQPGCAKTVLRS